MTHPALQKALDACRPLSAAASTLGAADPAEVLAHVDCDPASIESYAAKLRDSVAELDKAIDEQKATITELQEEEGEGAAAAIDEAKKELSELEQDRAELDKLSGQISEIGQQMEQLVVSTCEQIASIANGARPAAEAVAAGVAEDGDEERVIKAIDEIIRLAQQFQAQVDQLRQKFQSLVPGPAEAEAGGGSPGSSEGGVNEGEAEAGTSDGGGSEGGVNRGDGGEGHQAPSGGAGSGGN
ncbi:hypothetical protein [Amycolatopsis sp. 195334CR]|uniref:hypothetical protein n=1 Tax=Amycolatopsis sp. 195334CR TaxID=2814588 RepID=UPI001A908613|nr:hypothetical protein [Amycolatopsis sp. 195334CR]MBN6036115.1 hypothetical protein [Amycolatopsis sp. 195334CR]